MSSAHISDSVTLWRAGVHQVCFLHIETPNIVQFSIYGGYRLRNRICMKAVSALNNRCRCTLWVFPSSPTVCIFLLYFSQEWRPELEQQIIWDSCLSCSHAPMWVCYGLGLKASSVPSKPFSRRKCNTRMEVSAPPPRLVTTTHLHKLLYLSYGTVPRSLCHRCNQNQLCSNFPVTIACVLKDFISCDVYGTIIYQTLEWKH